MKNEFCSFTPPPNGKKCCAPVFRLRLRDSSDRQG
jgi:hypothetical protein